MRLLLFIFSIALLIYFLSSPGETYYKYFTRLSGSFISGKLYITQNPPWLNELVSVNSKYYVVYPPMPAIILIPFLLILVANGIGQRPKKWAYLLVALSIIINAWGTILINKFNTFII